MKKLNRFIITLIAAVLLLTSIGLSENLIYADPDSSESTETGEVPFGDPDFSSGIITNIGNPPDGQNSYVVDDDLIGGGGTSSGIILPDGIYSFKNLNNANRWMDVQLDSTIPGYFMQQYNYVTSPAYRTTPASVPYCGLYRVTRRASTGTYIIRLMIAENLTFGINGSYFSTKQISLNDSQVSDADTFYIQYNSGGFTIRPYASDTYYVCAPSGTGSGYADRPGSQLIKSTLSAAGNRARWIPEGYHSVIQDGIYSFKNKFATSRYMDVRRDRITPDNHMQQYSFNGVSPDGYYQRSGLYKVSQIGTTGRYVIRLMLNNRLSFGLSNNWVMTKLIPPNDSQVDELDTFTFSYNNGAYYIIPYGSSYAISSHHQTASGAIDGDNSALVAMSLSAANSYAKWIPSRYVGAGDSGFTVAYQGDWNGEELQIGTSGSAIIATWHCGIGVNDSVVECTSSEDIATSSWIPSNQTLTLSAHGAGTADITIRITKNSTTYSTYNTSYQCAPLANGVYAFKNRGSGKYLQIGDDYAPMYQTIGGFLEQADKDDENYQKWCVEYNGDGYYKITSFISGLAVSVLLDEETEENVALRLLAYTTMNNRQKWKIIATGDGTYKLRAKSSATYIGQELCMSVGSSNAEGSHVLQGAYSQDSDFHDEWELILDIANSSQQQPSPNIQNKTNWCWATSAKMVAEHNTGNKPLFKGATTLLHPGGLHQLNIATPYYGLNTDGFPTADTGQRKIVMDVKSADGNYLGDQQDLVNALTFASNNEYFCGFYGPDTITVRMSEDLQSGNWVVANLSSSNGFAHDIVIKSFDGTQYFYCDPWSGMQSSFSIDQLRGECIQIGSSQDEYCLKYAGYCHAYNEQD